MSNRIEFIITKVDGKFTTEYNGKKFTAATIRALDNAMTRAKVPLYRTFRVVESGS